VEAEEVKTYLIKSYTNYDLMVHVVNADSPEEARALAGTHKPAPWDGAEIVEIDTKTRGVVAYGDDRT
jgi:hypothetical protein